jgi:hypothetical protein
MSAAGSMVQKGDVRMHVLAHNVTRLASEPKWMRFFATLTQHYNPARYICSNACTLLCLAAAVTCPQHQVTNAAAAVHQQTCVQQITQGVPSFHALSSKTLCQR